MNRSLAYVLSGIVGIGIGVAIFGNPFRPTTSVKLPPPALPIAQTAANNTEPPAFPRVGKGDRLWDKGEMIDFTDMSATMVFSAATDITGRPSKYAGKRIRLSGMYHEYADEKGIIHTSVIVKDALGCCQQGIEIEVPAGASFVKGDPLTISGTLGTYKVQGVEESLPDWTNKNDNRYDGVLNVVIVRDVTVGS